MTQYKVIKVYSSDGDEYECGVFNTIDDANKYIKTKPLWCWISGEWIIYNIIEN